jgi:hypothetical protein
MSDKFDAYDYVGVIAPGSVAILAAGVIYPDLRLVNIGSETSIGGLGLFLIMSFVAGHLLQSIGSLIGNALWWPFGGLPTQWVLKVDQSLIAEDQATALFARVATLRPNFDRASANAPYEWIPLARELYSHVQSAKRSDRIDTFNRTYGLMRGIAAGFLIAAILTCVQYPGEWWPVLVMCFCAGLALYRTYHFGVLYARELLVTFVTL